MPRTLESEFDVPSLQACVLSCLQGMTRLAIAPGDLSLEELLTQSLSLLREAFPSPPATHLAIHFRDHNCGDDLPSGIPRLDSPILYRSEEQGSIAVGNGEGGEFPEVMKELLKGVGGQLSLVIEHRLTLTDYDDLQRQLRHADRLATLGQLAAGVAHQLNEPLGSILGYAQLATKVDDLPTQVKGDLERIIDASLDAREVIRKLLLFARQMPSERSRITFDRIVEEGLWFFESRCADLGIELVRDLGNRDKSILADETQLRQVLVNLVVNAIQAMPEGGRLVVRTREERDEAILEVSDTGVGMEDAILDQIFAPFFTTKDVDEGTGLGLAIVHGIVKAHGGEIRVESNLGEGSRFMVRLPIGEGRA